MDDTILINMDDIQDYIINIDTILDNITNNMLVDFSHCNNYEDVKIKETLISKITNNIVIIKNLYYNNLINYDEIKMNSLCNHLQSFILLENNKNLKYYKTIKKTLGNLIYDIYRDSDYDILMSNIPLNGNLVSDDSIEKINSNAILDTLEQYIGLNTIDNVIQVSEQNYLVKIKLYNDSVKICNLLNKKQICNNIIKVELLNHNKNVLLDIKPILDTEPMQVIDQEIKLDEPLFKYNIDNIDSIDSIDSKDEIEIINSTESNTELKLEKVKNIDNLLVVDLAYGLL